MKFSIKDLHDDTWVKLDLVKQPQNKGMTLVMDGSRDIVAEFSSRKGKLAVTVNQNLASTGTTTGSSASTVQAGPAPSVDELRNWEWKGDQLIVTNPGTGFEVALNKASTPGPMVPDKNVKDILGQLDMMYAVAYALSSRRHSLLIGPTGTGKTSAYRWFAKQMGWNLVIAPISRGTEAAHLVGDYMPTGQALFEWMDGPVTEAIRLSQQGPTLLVFDEINRIGNIAEFSRVYSVLDDTRMLELKEKRDAKGNAEKLEVGELMIGATANPSDDEAADYMGVQDLDPALSSRFGVQPSVTYPPEDVELEALIDRVPKLDRNMGARMVRAAKQIRDSADVRFPISFRELENWASAEPAFGYHAAARVTVLNKAPRAFHSALENILQLT